MQKAVFLDRDGVILNDEGHYYIFKPEDVKINEGVITFMKQAHDRGYKIIIISNQSGIGKGIYTKQDVALVQQALYNIFDKEGIQVEDAFFCPHHPDTGRCICRKPSGLMIEKAIAKHQIDVKQSFMIGDSKRDVEAAEAAGIKGVKIEKNCFVAELVQRLG